MNNNNGHKESIISYLSSKQFAWSVATQRSEFARLSSLADALDGSPATLWAELEARKAAPYTRSTTFVRVGDYYDFLINEGMAKAPNVYKAFKKNNAKLFKNAYVKRSPDITYEQAEALIGLISNDSIREKAMQLLRTGMRYTESFTLSNGEVKGKGGKTREIYGEASALPLDVCYKTFLDALKNVGLKPHDLRKIFITKAVESGLDVYELQDVAGWSSLEPAMCYIRVNAANIKRKLATFQGGTKGNETVTLPGKLSKAG